ncbi:MAG TPA: serine hydrolase [Natronosporangium sp.]|nr:serine hydrolase [Natronosporangium sp.]
MVATGLATAGAGPVPAAQPSPSPPPFVPCPVVELDPPPQRPSPPPTPVHDPWEREVGGAALATAGLVVPPDAPDLPDQLSATYWLVADLDTGAVLGACGPHEYGIPASTQKLLLALTLLDELDPHDVVEVLPEDLDFEPGSSAVGLLAGGRYPVETLWLGLLLNSGNDAAQALARVGGGPEGVAGTLAKMNRTAWLLGAYQTHAVTPSGLDGPGQFTSAYDLALIARRLYQREDFLRYISTERTQIPPQPPRDPNGFQIQNQDPMLAAYEGALGGKTGYTDLARHSYVGAAERDGRRLVVTVLGAENRPVPAWQQATALLDWGFSLPRRASVGRLVEPGEALLAALLPDPGAPEEVSAPPVPPAQASAPVPPVVRWLVWLVGGVAAVVLIFGVVLMAAGVVLRRR